MHIEKDKLGTADTAVRAPETIIKQKTSINNNTTASSLSSTTSTQSKSSSGKVNTTTLDDVVEFQTSAHELYETLLDAQRVSIWTRGPAKISKEKGSKFELFNGNVRGELLESVCVISGNT